MPSRLKHENEIILCGCGCGAEMLRYDSRGRERRILLGHAHKGKVISQEQRAKISQSLQGHSSAWKGRCHTPETRAKMSASLKGRKYPSGAAATSARMRKLVASGQWVPPKRAGRGVKGKRADLGDILWSSSWESNLARLLNHFGIEWQYEQHRFTLSDGSSYRPDFYLPQFDAFIEVKGYWWPKTKARFAQFQHDFPDVRILVIDFRRYKKLQSKYMSVIPTWEDFRNP